MKQNFKKEFILFAITVNIGLALNLKGQVPIIDVFAGILSPGYFGDGMAATHSGIWPSCVAVDLEGNGYIADYGNNRIRKVNATTGIITTIAGYGYNGYTGDGGLATAAKLNFPSSVTVDTAGNVYFIDGGSSALGSNNRVRKINASTGIISTIAGNGVAGYSGDGGSAISAQVYYPLSLAVDLLGNIYITDNYRVRKINTTGIITTIAGNGNTGYSGDGGPADSASMGPTSVAVDAASNIYIADQGNHRIRKVNASTGIITTIAGNGNNLYIEADGIALSTPINEPASVAVDGSGNVYLISNFRIRKVDPVMGSIKTIAGKSFSNYSGDGGPAIDAELMTPSGLAVDAVGNIYFADGGTRIRKISINSTGVNNVFTDANISMYPNPATNQLFIENNGADVEQINIYNTTGSLVNQTKEPQNGSIDISGLANGVYLAEIKTKEASVRKRWVKM